MNEYVKVFLALAAVVGGIVCVLCYLVLLATVFLVASDYAALAVVGVLLIAAGATFFWLKRRSQEI